MSDHTRAPLPPGFAWLTTSRGRVIGAINWRTMTFFWKKGDESELIDLAAHRAQASETPTRDKETR